MASFFPLPPPGFEPVAKPSKAPIESRVEARRLTTNGTALDFEIDSRGRYVGGHAVDQGMALSLLVRQGSIASAPNVGHTLHEVEIGVQSTASDVRDRVLSSYPLSRYVADQLVEILDIEHEELDSGLKVAVSYKNLVSEENKKAFHNEGDPV